MTTPYFGPMGGISLPKWLVNPETDDEYAQRFPGTNGDPIGVPDGSVMGPGGMMVPPAQAVAPQGPGWQARLFGGADPLAGGLLNPQEARGLGRQSLLNFGLNVLQNSGPSPYKRGLGEILAGGVLSGQQAYQQGTQQALGAQGIVTQRQNQARLQALHQRYAGRSDTASLTAYLNDLIGVGTPEALAAARSLSEVLKSQREPSSRLIRSEEMVDGKPTVVFRRADNGEVVTTGTDQPPAARTTPNLSVPPAQFARTLYDPFVVKSINTYHQLESHFAQARQGNPAAYKAAVSAFIANAEPNNQLRLGMLQYLQEVDPSVQGRADIALQKLRDGTWPTAILDGMQSVARHNYDQVRQRTQAIYDDYMAHNPGAYITPPSIRFGDAQTSGAPARGADINPITGKPRGR